ncbi:MAG: hypothetical protein P8H18_03875, partial [Flavobacteriaceae bacterium]|nr:hypothetical protein [Flavobacteriaceae bacterium]
KALGDRHYVNIENCLLGLGIIIKNSTYAPNRFSKSLSFTEKAIIMGFSDSIVYSKKFNKKLLSLNQEKLKTTYSNPLLYKVLLNTAKLKIIEEPFYYAERIVDYIPSQEEGVKYEHVLNKFKAQRYDVFYTSFKALNDITDPKRILESSVNYTPTIADSGRVYHLGASIPKYIRESMRTKNNELIWEIDMSSAQPSIFFLEWLKYAKNYPKDNLKSEMELCLRLVLNGEIYSYISNNSDVYRIMKYKDLKKSVLTIFNADKYVGEKKDEMIRLFPNLMKWVFDMKKKSGYTSVSKLGHKTEADIFVEVYKTLPDEIFCLIIHDCILVTKENLNLVRERLEGRVRVLYKDIINEKYSLEKLFKVSLVSLTDKQLIKTQFEDYLKTLEVDENQEIATDFKWDFEDI